MLPDKLQEICNSLMAKRNRKADIDRLRVKAELDTIQRETDAYMDGIYDAIKKLQQELPDYIKTLDAVKPELKAALLTGNWDVPPEPNKE